MPTNQSPRLLASYAVSSEVDARIAGVSATRQALAGGLSFPLSAVLVFSSMPYRLSELLEGVQSVVGNVPVLGGTTSAQIRDGEKHGNVMVVVLASPHLRVSCAVGSKVSKDWRRAVDDTLVHSSLATYFGPEAEAYRKKLRRQGTSLFALVLFPGNPAADEAHGREIVEEINVRSGGQIPICGGCIAGDAGKTDSIIAEGGTHRDSLLLAVFETQTRFGMGVCHSHPPTLPGKSPVTGADSQAVHQALIAGQIEEPVAILEFTSVPSEKMFGKQMAAAAVDLSGWDHSTPAVKILTSGGVGVCKEGVSHFGDGLVSALVLGADLSLVADMYHERQRLLDEQKREVAERMEEEQNRETMIANLRAVLNVADSLLACPDEDSVCREAVEMVRTKLGLDRCSIFLLQDSEMVGTYGTNIHGRTTCERDIRLPVSLPAWLAYHAQNGNQGARWKILDQGDLVEWDGKTRYVVGSGWTVSTLIWPKLADSPLGVMYNDTAITHAPLDSLKQEVLAVFCATLGSIIECKRRDRKIRFQAMLLDQIQDVVTATDMEGRITFVNQANCELLGKKADDIIGTYFESYGENPARGATHTEIAEQTRTKGHWRGTVVNNIDADGSDIVLDCRTQLVRDPDGKPVAMIGVATDITVRDRQERTTAIRLRLLDYAVTHTVDELLQRFLDEIEELTTSEVAFFHFVESDEKTLSLQTWSTNTLAKAGTLGGKEQRSPIDPGDSWLDAVRERGPVIHNDCGNLPHGCALLVGHTPVVRELMVPIVRAGRIVAVLGVGNKRTDYRDADTKALSQLADLAWETITRKRIEDERTRLTLAIEQAAEMVIITDAKATINYVNPAFEAVTGYTREEAIGQTPRVLKSGEHGDAFYRELWGTLTAGRAWNGRLVNRKKNGTLYTEEAVISPIRDHAGRTINYVAVKRDITRELEQEEQLRQQQKMEAIGRLAGGVAHDFNNLLMGIMNYVELCRDELGPDHLAREWLNEVISDARRSAEIVRQLLGFARKQTIMPRVLDLNETISGMLNMLRRLIRENIHFAWIPASVPCMVNMDPGQIDQILANLVVNARDAIEGGGRITIETACVNSGDIDRGGDLVADVKVYILLAVSDDGNGMEPAIIEHIFEPFFTTKPIGEGTGLGLANVYGIVKQNGGFVRVDSEPGKGTRIEVYLPRLKLVEKTAMKRVQQKPEGRIAGKEVLLLVEDERSIRMTLRFSLEKLGYTLLVAESAEAALDLLAEYTGEIDLLISDVMLPGLSGPELGQRLCTRFPQLVCLYMSGYAPDTVVNQGLLEMGDPFLQKPVPIDVLTTRVRELLDGRAGLGSRTEPHTGA